LRIPDLNPDKVSAVETPTNPVRSSKALNRNLIISPAGDIQRDLIPSPSASSIPVSRQIWEDRDLRQTAVAPAPHGAGTHTDHESTASGGVERRPSLQKEGFG